jgi:hypothetical protein
LVIQFPTVLSPLWARDLLGHGMVFVTIIADGRVYTMEEFALTIDETQQQFR